MSNKPLKGVFIKDQEGEFTTAAGFHTWEKFKNSEISKVNGIIQLEDGTIIRVDAGDIKFRNVPFGANLFEEAPPVD